MLSQPGNSLSSIIHLYDAPYFPGNLPATHHIEATGSSPSTTLISSAILNLYNNEIQGTLGWFVDGDGDGDGDGDVGGGGGGDGGLAGLFFMHCW